MHVVVVDGLNLIRRVHAALALRSDGESSDTAVAGACRASLVKLLRKQHPSHAMCVMDGAGPSWRHQEYPEYKATRPPMPEALRAVIPAILEEFATVGVRAVEKAGFEADDVIATIAVRVAGSGGRVTISSTDKSFCQLLGTGVRVYDQFADHYLDRHHVLKQFDVEPELLSTLFALTGNPSVNVPGVHSVGVRTAAKLIHDFGELERILAAAEGMKGHLGAKLRAGSANARRAMRLLSLRTDLDLGFNLKEFRLAAAETPRPGG